MRYIGAMEQRGAMMRQSRSLLVAATLLPFGSAVVAQDYRYAVIQLPSLDSSFQADGIGQVGNSGDVVEGSPMGSPWYPHAVIWPRQGGVIDLGTLGGDLSSARAINDLGEVVGGSGVEPGGSIFVGHAYVWRNGDMFDLGTLGGESSGATAINDHGLVVGGSEFEPDNYWDHAFIWEDGHMLALPGARPDTFGNGAYDINSQDEAVGWGSGLDFQYNGLLWHNGNVVDLGSLSGQGSQANAINNSSTIAGQSKASNGNTHAVAWVDRQIIDLHDARLGTHSWAQDINDNDQIVGAIGNGASGREGFVLQLGGQIELLKDLIPPQRRTNWRIDHETINNAGQISASAEDENVQFYALLLTPVHPTMNLRSPLPGTAGTSNRLRVSGVTPGQRIVFLYSLHGGGTRIPGCDLQENALQLDKPTIIGSAVANENGVATITRHVPLLARGQTVLFQAVVQNECAISQLVVWQFE